MATTNKLLTEDLIGNEWNLIFEMTKPKFKVLKWKFVEFRGWVLHIYIYIYIEREREREREKSLSLFCFHVNIQFSTIIFSHI